jgi:hypothetical protein
MTLILRISYSFCYRTITESAVDRLLMELTNEKQERTALEQATQSQAEEFLARLDRLQRYIAAHPIICLLLGCLPAACFAAYSSHCSGSGDSMKAEQVEILQFTHFI